MFCPKVFSSSVPGALDPKPKLCKTLLGLQSSVAKEIHGSDVGRFGSAGSGGFTYVGASISRVALCRAT